MSEDSSEILRQLAALQRDVSELIVLVKQIGAERAALQPAVSEERFFDAEGGE